MNVLICPDKFKGTLTADEAATAIADGWKKVRPNDRLTLQSVSDGGDGFGAIMAEMLDARLMNVKSVNAAHQPITGGWWWKASEKLAIIEAANIIGLAMLQKQKFHPFNLNTYGLGVTLQAAAKKGAKKALIGIGGSATNDAGFGMARALGWKFLDRDGHEIIEWLKLSRLSRVAPPKKRRVIPRVTVAVDVSNPLLGANGCARVFGPQKGCARSI